MMTQTQTRAAGAPASREVGRWFGDLERYSWHTLRHDAMAGLTVAVVAVPQSMAYAMIAGVPPVYGLYTAIVQGLIGALMTSSSHLSIGPINTLSLLVASAVARLTNSSPERYLELVLAMTLLVGLIQSACAVARMGGFVKYVSHEVIVGFTAGAGILIAVGQVPNFLGVSVQGVPRHLPGVLGAVERLTHQIHLVNWSSVAIGMGSLLLVVGSRAISKLVPGPLLAAIGGAAVVWTMGWSVSDLPLVGDLPQGLPSLHVPSISWADAESLFGAALALALVGMLEAFSIAKAIACHTGQDIQPNREFLTQGVSNLVSGFFQCIPGSGSFSRSALTYQAGARTRVAGVLNSLFVAGIFLMFAPLARYVPLASLAAILFVVSYHLVDWRHLLRVLHSNRDDAAICLVTMAATLLIPLEFAIFVGVLLNIAVYVGKASKLHIAEMVSTPAGPYVERPLMDRQGKRRVIFLQVEGDLFFGVADELQTRLANLAREGVSIIILRLKRTHSLDSSVLNVLERFAMQMQQRNGHVILCGVKPELMRVITRYGLVQTIGKDNVFETGYGIFTSAKRALERAKQLLNSSIDTEGLDMSDEPEGWAYEI